MRSSSAVRIAPAGDIAQTAARDSRAPARASSANLKVLPWLRAGDESVLSELVRRYHRPLLRFALALLPSEALAEDVVQDTWTAVVENLASFHGWSSPKTWIYQILTNRAKCRRFRQGRWVPFSALKPCDSDNAAVDPARFVSDGHWAESLRSFTDESAEKQLIQKEAISCLKRALCQLPFNQRAVFALRDVQGMGSDEICDVLGIRRTNQRVLLHRARSKLRRALEPRTNGEWLPRLCQMVTHSLGLASWPRST